IDKGGGLYELSAASPGLPGVSSAFFKVIAGPASRLALSVQPSTVTAGATITPPVEVTARDALGNTADGFTASVTVAIGQNPGVGTLSGTQTVAAVAGVASFPTLSVDRAGSGYTLVAAAAGPSGATSAPFDVTATRATQLIFTAQPTSTTAGATISPAVQVTARDASGRTATSFTGSVTLTITAGTGTGGATLSGTTTAAAVAGVATFSTLSIDRTGVGYDLQATASGLALATSTAFAIIAGRADRLLFTVQPSTTTAAGTMRPSVRVTALDALGNRATRFTGAVTVALTAGTGTAGATLSGATTVAAVDGVAIFSTLSVDRVGNGYTLSAAAAGLTGATSTAFGIN